MSDFRRWRAGVLASSGVAWLVLLGTPERTCHCFTRSSGTTLSELFASQALASAAYGWLVMLVAMMAPMTLAPLAWIRVTSLTSRRLSSSALFVTGYALVWMAAGGVMHALEVLMRWATPWSYAPALVVLLLALIWQASPIKQKCLNRCHSHQPLAAFGWAAARDALLMGVGHGFWCTGSCWAMMLFPMLLPEGHQLVMAAVTLVMLCERLDPPARPTWRLRGFGTITRWMRLRWLGLPGTERVVASARS